MDSLQWDSDIQLPTLCLCFKYDTIPVIHESTSLDQKHGNAGLVPPFYTYTPHPLCELQKYENLSFSKLSRIF